MRTNWFVSCFRTKQDSEESIRPSIAGRMGKGQQSRAIIFGSIGMYLGRSIHAAVRIASWLRRNAIRCVWMLFWKHFQNNSPAMKFSWCVTGRHGISPERSSYPLTSISSIFLPTLRKWIPSNKSGVKSVPAAFATKYSIPWTMSLTASVRRFSPSRLMSFTVLLVGIGFYRYFNLSLVLLPRHLPFRLLDQAL